MNKSYKIAIGIGVGIIIITIIILVLSIIFNTTTNTYTTTTTTTTNTFQYQTSTGSSSIQCNRAIGTKSGSSTSGTSSGTEFYSDIVLLNWGDVDTYSVNVVMHTCPNTRVTWCNGASSTASFTVTSNTPGIFDSGDIAPGQCFSYIFKEPGDFRFHSTSQPQTKVGQIIVHDYT